MGRAPTSVWGRRARDAGLDQKTLAALTGMAPNSVSRGLRGEWENGVPTYLQTIIVAWEMLNAGQRAALLAYAEKDPKMPMTYRGCHYECMVRGPKYWEWYAYNGTDGSAQPIGSGSSNTSEQDAIAQAQHLIDSYHRKVADEQARHDARTEAVTQAKTKVRKMVKEVVEKRAKKQP
ncbi:MAG: hypothetical protein ABF876_05390 [Acetobacter aceti]